MNGTICETREEELAVLMVRLSRLDKRLLKAVLELIKAMNEVSDETQF